MRTILRQLLMALAHCHGQGVTHRNLKPKYVLLQPREVDTAAPDAPAAPAPRRHEATATPPPPLRGAEAEAARWRHRSMGGARARAEEEGEAGWWVKLSDFNSVRWLGAAMAAEDDPIYGAAQATRMGSSTSRTSSSTSRTRSSTSRTSRTRSSTSRTSNLVVRVGRVI